MNTANLLMRLCAKKPQYKPEEVITTHIVNRTDSKILTTARVKLRMKILKYGQKTAFLGFLYQFKEENGGIQQPLIAISVYRITFAVLIFK